jgi:hypothetical protein
MRHFGFLLGAIVLFAASAGAQASSGSPASLTPPTQNIGLDAPAANTLYAVASSAPTAPFSAAPAQPDPAPQGPGVQSVIQTYNWQAYFGYTFFRFYLTPRFTNNMNGLNLSMVYYPGGKWIGPDGEFIGTFGSAGNQNTKFAMGAGGGRVRWLAPHSIEVWGHGLVGYSHFLPQTALGSQSAFAYEVGGGVDLNVYHQRWAVRVSGDMIGTSYFNTHQYSPKISAGVVVKF